MNEEQELIPIMVTDLVVLVGATLPLQKACSSVVSNRIRMKFGSYLLHVNTQRLTQSDFFYILLLNFKMAAMTSFHAEKCCRLVNAHKASA